MVVDWIANASRMPVNIVDKLSKYCLIGLFVIDKHDYNYWFFEMKKIKIYGLCATHHWKRSVIDHGFLTMCET